MKTGQAISAIFQVRMGSTRLPGKVLADIAGQPLLRQVIHRVSASRYVNDIIIATTDKPADRPIVEFARGNSLKFFTGSEEDVLDRFYQAARHFSAGTIVRITPDDPFKDPEVIDRAVNIYLESNGRVDYVTNTLPPTYPVGLDIEVFGFPTLEKAWMEASKPSEREHVTPYIWKNPGLFRIENFRYERDLSHLRWTIDNETDLVFAREIYRRLYPIKPLFLMKDILDILEQEPGLSNVLHEDKYAGYRKSLEKDREAGRRQ